MASVDVIILSWDRLDDTIAAIASALAQDGIDLKVIVVDQGSRPENLEKLKAFCGTDSRVTLLCNSINNGVPGGRNQASFAGHGQYIVALDNDAVFESNTELQKMVAIMDQRPELGILAFRIKCFEKDCDDASSWPYSRSPSLSETTSTFKTNRFVGAGHTIRRDVFEKIHGYDDRLFFMHEEVDLAKRFINAGYTIEYNPSVVVRHKVSAEHRVSWNGKRFYYDVRNRTYLHIKHKTFFPTFVLHTALLMVRGFKLGYTGPAIKGLCSGLALLPSAISQWLSDPYLKIDAKAKGYYDACNPLKGYSPLQRISFRLKELLK